MLYTSYLANKLVDQLLRATAYTFPTTALSIGLLTSTKGPRGNSTVYALNDTISLTANDGKTHLYKCTTAGTSAAAQSTLYPGVNSEVITDGTAAFTEQAAAIRAGTAVEAAYTGYARSNTAASTANYAGTQGLTTTAVSSGTGVPTTANNTVLTFGATATSGPSYVWAAAFYDATTVGNMLIVEPLTTVKTINNGDPAPTFAISALTLSIDS
jgi:hypothetical protein